MSVHKDDVLLTTCKLNSERLEEIPWNTAGDPSSTGRSDFCSRIPHHKQSSIWPSRGKWYFNMWVWLIFLAGFSTEKIQEKKKLGGKLWCACVFPLCWILMVIFVHLRENCCWWWGVVWGSRALRGTSRAILLLACFLVNKYFSPGFSSLQLGVFGLSANGEHRQWQHQMLCPAALFSSDHFWEHQSHPHPHFSDEAKLFTRRQHFVSPQNWTWGQQFISDHPVNGSQVEFKHVVCTASASIFSGHRNYGNRLLFNVLGFAEL